MTNSTETRKGNWIQLISGAPFWPLDPRADEIEIEDIAWSLSYQCRFAGHVRRWYCVAEHCVHVSKAVSPENALWGLLHDATEAYLVDLPRPIKHSMPQYQEIEDRLAEVIAERFQLSWPMPDEVHLADTYLLHAERAALLAPSLREWELPQAGTLNGWKPAQEPVICGWSSRHALMKYQQRFIELTQEDN